MTVILRPLGRGNWQPVVLTIPEGKNAPLPLEFFVGMRVELCGHQFRVSKVQP